MVLLLKAVVSYKLHYKQQSHLTLDALILNLSQPNRCMKKLKHTRLAMSSSNCVSCSAYHQPNCAMHRVSVEVSLISRLAANSKINCLGPVESPAKSPVKLFSEKDRVIGSSSTFSRLGRGDLQHLRIAFQRVGDVHPSPLEVDDTSVP